MTTQIPHRRTRPRSRRRQDPPAGRLVLRRLCRRRHHAADRRRDAVRGARPARRQRVLDVAAGNGNATLAAARRWCDVDLDRLRAGAARARPRARAQAERLDDRLPRGRRRGPALRRRSLRRRAVDLRRDVHARTRSSAAAELLRVCRPGRPHRPRQLDARRASSASCSRRSARTCRRPPGVKSPALWGTRGAARRAVRRSGAARSRDRAAQFVFRYRSAGALDRGVPHLLRPDAQGLRARSTPTAGRAARRTCSP